MVPPMIFDEEIEKYSNNSTKANEDRIIFRKKAIRNILKQQNYY